MLLKKKGSEKMGKAAWVTFKTNWGVKKIKELFVTTPNVEGSNL